MADPNSIGESYDQVPYQSHALLEAHPDRMATVARLFGMNPAPVDSCRVLELGCAAGGNLIPMALGLPKSEFVGVDLSKRQIDDAKETVKKLGIKNVTLKPASLLDVSAKLGKFDYVICHGVYSWVPDAVKDRILELNRLLLKENGVGYVSYNVYPGWHVPQMLREMMVYRIRNLTAPKERIDEARRFLDYVAQAVNEPDGLYGRVVRDEAGQIRPSSDSYLFHEHLEEINEPIYFHQFVARAEAHKLKAVADARFWSMARSQQAGVGRALDQLSSDPLEREQYFDFLSNRRFRRTLLCHAATATLSEVDANVITTLRASALVWPTAVIDWKSSGAVEFASPDGTCRVNTKDAWLKAVLGILSESWPRSLPFETLWTLVRGRLNLPPAAVDSEEKKLLVDPLLQGYGGHAIELHTIEPSYATDLSERPNASPYARMQAENQGRVTNLRHRLVDLSDFDTLVLKQLDGVRDKAAIVGRLLDAVVSGSFKIHQNGMPLTDPAILRPLLDRSLEPSLRRIASGMLLVS